MKTLLIDGYQSYAAESSNGFQLITNEPMSLEAFWKFAARSIKTFAPFKLEFYVLHKNMKYSKYTKTELKRGLHRAIKGQPTLNLTKSEIDTLIEYFDFPKDKYLSEQMKIKFSANRSYPRGRAWSKEHYNIDHSSKSEVKRKRKVPARNSRKPATKKR